MDCQTCNDLLLDLAYGELDEVRAAAVRRHAEGCAECQQSLRRIERGRALARQLPTEEAPGITAAVRAALEAATAQPLPAGAAVPPSNASAEGRASTTGSMRPVRGVARWVDRVGELAMRRQVAMAALFVVMLGIGLVFYQSHPRPSDTQDDRVPDVVPAVEVPSNPAQPVANEPTANVLPSHMRLDRDDPARGHAVGSSSPMAAAARAMRGASHAGVHAASGGGAVARDSADPVTSGQEAAGPGAMVAQSAVAPQQAPDDDLAPRPAQHVARVEPQAQGMGGAVANAGLAGWQAAEQGAEAAASRGDAQGAIDGARQAVAQAPSANTRLGIAMRMAPILRRLHRAQEADELEAQAGVTTAATAMRPSEVPAGAMHRARRAASPSQQSGASAPARAAGGASAVDSSAAY